MHQAMSTFVTTAITVAGPMGIAVDAKSGNVYVSDYGANRIQKFNSNGSVLPFKRLPTGAGDGQLRQPAGVAVDAITGNVYVCDQGNHRIQKFDSNGIFIKTWGTEGSRNSEFGPPLSSGKYNGPFGITVDASVRARLEWLPMHQAMFM